MKEQPQIWTCGVSGAKTVDRFRWPHVDLREFRSLVPNQVGQISYQWERIEGRFGWCIAGVFTIVSRDDIVLSASWLYWGIVQSIVRFGQDASGKSISDGFDRFPLLPMFSVYYHQRPKQRMTFQFLNAYQKRLKHIYTSYIVTINQ